MRMLKECSVCGINIGTYLCRKCHGNICESDYDKENGVCENCKFSS